MKKGVSIAIIAAIIIVGLAIAGFTTYDSSDSENPPSNQNEPSVETTIPEGKNYVLELSDAVSTKSP